jgi:hypothetical protein
MVPSGGPLFVPNYVNGSEAEMIFVLGTVPEDERSASRSGYIDPPTPTQQNHKSGS